MSHQGRIIVGDKTEIFTIPGNGKILSFFLKKLLLLRIIAFQDKNK